MKANIFIGTTAINRPELHSNIFPDWIDWITELDNSKYNVVWIINIDVIEYLASTFNETKENIIKINDNRLNIIFCEESDSNFLTACKKVSQKIIDYSENTDGENVATFWLEDDWKLDKNKIVPFDDIMTKYCKNLTYVSLTSLGDNYLHALAPSILSFDMWKNNHYETWKHETKNTDPEHCAGLKYRRNFGRPHTVVNITIINEEINSIYYMLPCNKFFNHDRNYYIDNIGSKNNRIKGEAVTEEDIFKVFPNRARLIRFYPPFCKDCGRKFMVNKGIHKRSKKDNSGSFYHKI